MEKIRGEKQKREAAGAPKGRKVPKHCVFHMFCGSGGSKSKLATPASAEPAGQTRDAKCTMLWHEAHVEVNMYKAHHARTTFGS